MINSKESWHLSLILILLLLSVLIGVGCKAKESTETKPAEAPTTAPTTTSTASAGNLIKDENDFSSKLWIKKDAIVTPAAVSAPEGQGKADMIKFKKKEAIIFQGDNLLVKPGDTASGSMYLWAKQPVILKIGIIRHCDNSDFEGTFKDIRLTDKPVQYEVSHTFAKPHGCARIQLFSHKNQEIYAWGAKLNRNAK